MAVMVMAMDVLPDCANCGSQVVLNDGVEECVACPIAQPPLLRPDWQAYWRERVQRRVAARKGEL